MKHRFVRAAAMVLAMGGMVAGCGGEEIDTAAAPDQP